jgi:hypothetical protein
MNLIEQFRIALVTLGLFLIAWGIVWFIVNFPDMVGTSEIKTETGIVVEKQYKPATRLSGTSINTSADLQFHNLSEQERFMVLFKCDHGIVFGVNDPRLYAHLEKNDTVTIEYKEVYLFGKFYDFHFLDAYK